TADAFARLAVVGGTLRTQTAAFAGGTGNGAGVGEENPSFTQLEAARQSVDPPADAERTGFFVERGRGFVELLPDPQQAGAAHLAGRHAERAGKLVGAVAVHAAHQARDIYPGETAALFEAV